MENINEETVQQPPEPPKEGLSQKLKATIKSWEYKLSTRGREKWELSPKEKRPEKELTDTGSQWNK